MVILRIQEEICDLISKVAIVQIDDVPNLCLSPIFRYPLEIRGSSSNFLILRSSICSFPLSTSGWSP